MKDEDQALLERIKTRGPFLVAGLPIAAFVLIKVAGHTTTQALIVAAVMLGFTVFLLKVAAWFGLKIAAVICVGISAIMWLMMQMGWI